jgi:orotate phosphoribosyltransferase
MTLTFASRIEKMASAQEFLRFCRDRGVLRFGEFTLKSGRISPYFFNAGLFNQGSDLALLGEFYADAIVASGVDFDMLFGPAYKGIPLVAATSIALHVRHGRNFPWAFNRKEVKDHGEGGSIVGAPLQGRVLVVDDVVTAGTAIREALGYINGARATPAGVALALDRQERGQDERSAIQEIEQDYGLPVITVATLSDLIDLMHTESGNSAESESALRAYQARYGAK